MEYRFFLDHRGHCPPKEFINALPAMDRAKVRNGLRLLQEFGVHLNMPHVKQIQGKLWELRQAVFDCFISHLLRIRSSFSMDTRNRAGKRLSEKLRLLFGAWKKFNMRCEMARRHLPSSVEWEEENLKDSEFLKAAEVLEPGYQVARLRIQRGLTQARLAELVGTKQPSIARLEAGSSTPSISFLKKIAEALNARMEIRFIGEAKATYETKPTEPK